MRNIHALLSSGVQTGDVAIKATEGIVYWATLSCTATGGVVGLANSATNSTTYLWTITLPTASYVHCVFDPPLRFSTAIWLDVVGGTWTIVVGYV